MVKILWHLLHSPHQNCLPMVIKMLYQLNRYQLRHHSQLLTSTLMISSTKGSSVTVKLNSLQRVNLKNTKLNKYWLTISDFVTCSCI